MSDQAESQRTRNCTSVLYMPTRTAAITTRITRRIMALINVSSVDTGIIGTVAQRGRRRNHGWLASSDSVKRNLPIGNAVDLTPVATAKEAGASWNARRMTEIACKLER